MPDVTLPCLGGGRAGRRRRAARPDDRELLGVLVRRLPQGDARPRGVRQEPVGGEGARRRLPRHAARRRARARPSAATSATRSSPTRTARSTGPSPLPHIPGLPFTVFVDANGTIVHIEAGAMLTEADVAAAAAEVPRGRRVIPDWLQPVVRAAQEMTADDLTRFVAPEDADTRRGAVLLLFGVAARPAAHRAGPRHALPPGAGVVPRRVDRPRRDAARGRPARGRGGDRPAGGRRRGLRRAAGAVAAAEQLRGDAGARLVARGDARSASSTRARCTPSTGSRSTSCSTRPTGSPCDTRAAGWARGS